MAHFDTTQSSGSISPMSSAPIAHSRFENEYGVGESAPVYPRVTPFFGEYRAGEEAVRRGRTYTY